MKSKYSIILILMLFIGHNAEAQFLKKLKQKAEQAAMRAITKKAEKKAGEMAENAFDSVADLPNKKSNKKKNKKSKKGNSPANNPAETLEEGENAAHTINTAFKRSFYHSDLVITTSENGVPGSSFNFDTDALAMRGKAPKDKHPIYIDSEAYQYTYNDRKQRWEKSGLMKSDAMSFMLPMMSTSMLNLPNEPMMQASEELKANGLSANTFQLVEMAFIYKPEHFRSSKYIESSMPQGLRFDYTDSASKGSYVLFDNEGNLTKINAITVSPEGTKTGVFNFNYSDVTVDIPKSVMVKMPLQGLLMKGKEDKSPTNERDADRERKEIVGVHSQGGGSPSTNNGSPDTNNGSTPSNNGSSPSNTNGIATTPIAGNPFSYEGITVILEADGEIQTYRLDTRNWIQEIDYHGYEGLKPTYFALDGMIYTHVPEENRYVCADLKQIGGAMGKMFGKMFEKMLKKGNLGIKKEKLEKYVDDGREIIEVIMELYRNAPTNLQNAALFPIGNWPYIYGLFRVPIFENDNYIKSENDGLISYTVKDKPDNVIYYDALLRPSSVKSKDGLVEFRYDIKHSLTTPPCSQMLGE